MAIGQHSITVSKQFEKNQQTSKVLLQFELDSDLTESELSSITQWSADNKQFLDFSKNGKQISLYVNLTSFEQSIYLKAFMMMNISDIKLSDGKSISIEEFLSKNNL
jgi:predicted nucleotidyltransferase